MACCASCCHSKAKLSFTDKLLNFALSTFKLEKLGDKGLTGEAHAQFLAATRKTFDGVESDEGYKKKATAKHWNVEYTTVPRPADQGGDIPVVVHIPKGGQSGVAAMVFGHGGGMVLPGYKDGLALPIMAGIADAMGTAFCWVSVDYRLAPEHPFPKGIDDMVYVYEYMQEASRAESWGYAPGKVGFAGISAGGYCAGLAAVRVAKPAFAAALNPMVDPAMDKQSYKDYGNLPSCPLPFMEYCWQALLAEEPGKAPSEARKREGSMLHADWTRLAGVQVLNVTAAYELFYDDGVELTQRMEAGGVRLKHIVGSGSHAIALSGDKTALAEMTKWFVTALRA